MLKFVASSLALMLVGQPLLAQQTDTTQAPAVPQGAMPQGAAPGEVQGGRCLQPDTVTVTGNSRVEESTIRGTMGIVPHTQINYPDVQRAIKSLFATGNFDDVKIICSIAPKTLSASLDVRVKERPVLTDSRFVGDDKVSHKDLKERLDLVVGSPVDPSAVANAVTRADSLYQSKGYYLAKITVDSSISNGNLSIAFKINEGRRLAVSGIQLTGNRGVSGGDVVHAMDTRPEGFWWFRHGEFDDAKYAGDLTDRIPTLYGSRGYIDFKMLHDTLIVDPSRGKGEVQLTLSEGPRYKIGSFEVLGNKYFSLDQVRRFYPFEGNQGTSLAQTALGIVRRPYKNPPGTFDLDAWQKATQKLQEAYGDEGYIYAAVHPIEERVPSQDSLRVVNLRWEVQEGSPAIINRIDIVGNDFTYESCIREQILMLPGDVFRRQAMISSYQGISSLNFFESPLPEPTVKNTDNGDVDITFKVREKRTGNVNFGASMGQGTGLGGFIGLDQPNLFGRCKRAQLQLQFGKYQNDVNLTYSDPNIRQSRISGSITAYHTRSRYQIADLGESIRTGGQLQFGFPIPNSYFSRFFLSYGLERVKYDDNSGTLLGTLSTTCINCFRSTLGMTFQHDTRNGGLFPLAGGMQSVSMQFNGGPLGGTSTFEKLATELKAYAPIFNIGSTAPGSQPRTFLVGLSARSGFVFGNPGPFFSSQSFALGGTQYGEALRGYCEFAITPAGFNPDACNGAASRQSFGNAFFVGTAELGFRFNSSLYFNGFMEGGNVWDKPRDFDPTRLYRSVGVGGSTMSPLGPLGLDFAYGLDRVDANGRKNPGWKVHFKLGQVF